MIKVERDILFYALRGVFQTQDIKNISKISETIFDEENIKYLTNDDLKLIIRDINSELEWSYNYETDNLLGYYEKLLELKNKIINLQINASDKREYSLNDKVFNVTSDVVQLAFKYSLGRMTFAQSTVVDNIKFNLESIDNVVLCDIIKDIDDHKNLGMKCDKELWCSFRDELEQYLKSKGVRCD